MPQPAWRLDSDFSRLFEGEVLLAVETLNVDAASFAQMEKAAIAAGDDVDQGVAHIVLRTVAERGKQHNPETDSGGMLLGRVLQVARTHSPLHVGDRVATLASLSLTPLRVDRILRVRRASAQIDVEGEAVIFATSPCAKLPEDLPERVALAALDVAGAAPLVARSTRPDGVVVILGGGGKSGVLCAVEARRRVGEGGRVVGVESSPGAAAEAAALGVYDAIVSADARQPVAARAVVLAATGGREADLTLSCVNVPGAEMAAILVTRERGAVCFFAMSTSFTAAALGAEGVGKDVDLYIGNGYAQGHAEHTLALLRSEPRLLKLFEQRYG